MNGRIGKLSFFSALFLLAAHCSIAAYSYYVPRWLSFSIVAGAAAAGRFLFRFDSRRLVYETIFAACAVNIPFGAGGYIYKPWTAAVAAAACILPAAAAAAVNRKWWPAFRWSFIAVVSIGFLFSAYMRSDLGSRCSAAAENIAAGSFSPLPSFRNPYGVYVAPGGCPAFSCYSMERKIGALPCGGAPAYFDVPGNPQRMTADTPRNRIYFPLRGTPVFIIAKIQPFELLKTAAVPGAASLLGADVSLKDGRLVFVDERRHSLFVLDPDSFEVKLSVPLGWGAAYSVAVDQARGFAFVSDWAGGFLHRVNLETGVVKKRWIGLSSFSIKTDSEKGLVYLARPFRSRIAVVDAESLEVLRLLPAGYGVRDLALDTKRNRIAAGNYFDGTVDVVNLKDGKRTRRYDVGPLVRGVAVDPASGEIYAAWTCGLSKLAHPARR